MKVSMKLFCSASNLWNRKIWNIEREPFAVCASPICTRETEQKLCSTGTPAGFCYLSLVEPEAIQPQDLAVIGHGDDLLYWIHARARTHLLPRNLRLFNLCGEGVQLARSGCSFCAVALFSFARIIQKEVC